ncbi:hypothetical protein HY621_01450 [Candidatus Uhrbacteria bacterium]|nr:hypothetical protein [Candidatus Uhrbacteria bacterium]
MSLTSKNMLVGMMCAMLFVMQAAMLFALPIAAETEAPEGSVRGKINVMLTNVGERVGIDTTRTIGTVVGDVIRVALGLLGLIFLILFTYGGFKYMEAKGEEKTVKEAMGLMFQAIVGMAIVLGAYAITEFFIGALQESAGFPK